MERAIRWIKDERLKAWVRSKLQEVPDYFWRVPASSTGKYHPDFAQGNGGCVRHTRVAVWWALELFEIWDFTEIEQDIIIAALILHDTYKYGLPEEEHTVDNHGELAAEQLSGDEEAGSIRWQVIEAVKRHMGKWGKTRPNTELEWFVHLCDYLSSRGKLSVKVDEIKC